MINICQLEELWLLRWLSRKQYACKAGDTGDAGSIRGQEGPLEKEMAIHSSILAWKIPRTEEPGRLHPRGGDELDTAEHIHTQ